MTEVFGIPTGSLLAILGATLVVALGIVVALALRNRVLFRLGVRNAGRRPGRTALIVTGLLLATTIVAAAFTTGDTMTNTIRQTAVQAMGETDVLVSARGAAEDIPGELGAATGTGYFVEETAAAIDAHLDPTGLVDGIAPIIVEEVALRAPASGQVEPGVSLFATDPARMEGFGAIEPVEGGTATLDELAPSEAFLNRKAAEELRAAGGDRVVLYAGGSPVALTVRAVVDYRGAGTADSALLLPLDRAQELLGKEGLIKHVAISNRGSGTEAAAGSDAVLAELDKVTLSFGTEAAAVKQEALEAADEAGNAFTGFFTTFGSFSIAAGILLVFLIFVMLAAERRSELGIARAIGTRRGHLVQMFTYEGLAYDLAAAAVGAILGAAVAFGMVIVMAEAFGASDEDAGLQLEYAVTWRSLLIAFALGVLLTLAVVAFSAWRVSAMTISTAIRNLPEPATPRRRRRWLLGAVAAVSGLLLVLQGSNGHAALPVMVGVSLVVIGLVPVLLAFRLPPRLVYTALGLAMVVLWLLPSRVWEAAFGELSMDFSIWIASGLMIVIGAVWVIVYNADVLLGAAMATLGRIRALAPILRLAMAYPLAGRFRTGTTLAMFTLVVFTLVSGAVTTGSFMNVFNDTEKTGGGFDVRAGTGAVLPITDLESAVAASPAAVRRDIAGVGSQSVLAVDAKQVGAGRPFETYMVRGLDDAFLRRTTFGLGAIARGYGSEREVWEAMASKPGLAVVDSYIVPRRDNFNFAVSETDFALTGLTYDDGVFDPIPIAVRDPQTQRTLELTVVGVLADTAPWEMVGISASQDDLEAAFPDRVAPTIHYFALAPGADPDAAAARIEASFAKHGLEADSIEHVVEEAMAASVLFNRLIQGFLGLGLLVGVAALGVITARAVVERRQHIGVLRALGFRRGMVELLFLLESSFVALTAIVVGTGLGLLLGWQVVDDQRQQASWRGMDFVVPWTNLFVIFAIVYLVAVAATLAPALRAARIRPAQALRYE